MSKSKQRQKRKEKQEKFWQRFFLFLDILLIIAWLVLIATIMLKPLPRPANLEEHFTFNDKIVHIFMFGGLSFLSLSFLSKIKKLSLKTIAIISFFFSFFWANFFEYLQNYIPGRSPDIFDLLFGTLGMLLALLLFYIYLYKSKPKLLLHICCATCGGYVSQLLSKDYRVILFYSNSNIYTEQEFKKRLKEVRKIQKAFHFPVIVDNYEHQDWLKAVKGHEADPERGIRCHICYAYRLKRTFEQAKKLNIKHVATTLSVSPHKLAQVINEKGRLLGQAYQINFLERDFKKQDGYKKSLEVSKQFNFYHQNYCGCEFSIRKEKK